MQPGINIVHIAAFVNGGAGTAAYRIHQAMLHAGIGSVYLCSDNDAGKSQVQSILPTSASLLKRCFNKAKRILATAIHIKGFNTRAYYHHRLKAIQPRLTCEVASLPFSEYDLINHPLVKNAQLVHLHWVAGFLDYPGFLQKIDKPVVWTFHDMNPLMGLFHYENDERRNRAISEDLDNEIVLVKKTALKKLSPPVAFVCPSEWLFRKARERGWFATENIHRIGYTLDAGVFCVKDKTVLRNEMGIPVSDTVFLFVSQTVSNYRKGFDLLAGALAQIHPGGISLLIIGEDSGSGLHNFNCIYTGFISDEALLSRYYSVSDAFVLPSREDNLPNVMLEALHCGVPVISFDTGGMASVIEDGFNGIKADETTEDGLQRALECFLATADSFDAAKIRQHALEQFASQKITQEYLQLYSKLLNESGAA